MTNGPNITRLASLMADPARSLMLTALMDGRALSAGELASIAGVTPQTASSHLAKMVNGGLLSVEVQGRHRYMRLANEAVAELIETMMEVAGGPTPQIRTGPRDAAMRQARVCYDHLAGEKGVALFDAIKTGRHIHTDGSNTLLTPQGAAAMEAFGIDVEGLRAKRRPVCRTCLDWSERRPHLAGSLGAALLTRMTDQGLARRVPDGRALSFSPDGERRFAAMLTVLSGA